MATVLTIGDVARHFGVPTWHIRRAIERGLLPEPPRAGAYRVFCPRDLPRIKAALRRCGYLREEALTAA
jgi:DNA-binding transcriptional MerR regulator